MSQIDFVRSTVSDFFDALISSDLADAATYTPPGGGAASPCRVLIRRGLSPFGDFGRVPGQHVQIRIVDADVVTDRNGIVATTSVTLGAEQFKLVERMDDNDALSTWSAIRV